VAVQEQKEKLKPLVAHARSSLAPENQSYALVFMVGLAEIWHTKPKVPVRPRGDLGRTFSRGHIDQYRFDIFVRERIYLRYAETFFETEQSDVLHESRITLHQPLVLFALTKSDYERQCLTVDR
jgi:hypothetical protein